MKFRKNILTAGLVGVTMLLGAVSSGCGEKKDSEDVMKQVADHLYETTFTEDFDWGTAAVSSSGSFGCSAIQAGQYRGRNYDWNYQDTDLCIVHTTVTENRPHASVGVADLSFLQKDGETPERAKIPFVTVDGINDAGVCIQTNVMPFNENGEIPHTETEEDDLAGSRVTRYVLDYAGSVEEALALLQEKDIQSVFGNEELHWMISGPASASDSTRKTVVLEVFPDGQHVTENFVGDVPIMTNFDVSNFDGSEESVGIGLGYERWQILLENAAEADSVIGTFDLMEKVFYSKAYDLYGDRFWYSEYAGTDLRKYYSEEELVSLIGRERYDAEIEQYGIVPYTPDLWDGETAIHGDISKTGLLAPVIEVSHESYIAQKTDGSLWITLETAVYDLENLTLDIAVRESQDHHHFTIE